MEPIRKKYRFAIRVYSTDLGFTQTRRNIDFLLDGRDITRENTVFIAEDAISDQYREEFQRRGYDLLEIKKIPWWRLVTLPLTTSVLTFDKDRILRAYEEAAWEFVLKQVSFDHLICYNDTSPAHRFRNAVLNRHGILTWYYNHSSDYAYLYEKDDDDGKDGRTMPYPLYEKDKEIYKGLEYDRMICWNEKQVDFFKKLGCRIGEYIVTGSLWSQHIGRKKEYQKKIGVFDTSIKDDQLPNTETDIARFYEGIIRLKSSFPEYEFVMKPKNLVEPSLQLKKIYSELKKRDIFTIPKGQEPSTVIGESAVIICAPFTSIAVEAREAGIPAVYYDASDKWRGTYYDRQGIVAHTFEELEDLVRKSLETGIADKRTMGIDRFRQALLAAKN
jgi:polysaccharide biosynthesis PFTS motif protein